MSLSLTDLQREQPRQVPLANWQDVLQAELNAFDTASSTVAGIGGLVLSQLLAQHYMGTVLPTGITESDNGVFETMSAWLADIAAVVK